MDSRDEGRDLITEILKNSSAAERGEFSRRLRLVRCLLATRYNLNKKFNALREEYQDALKRRNRTESITVISILVFLFFNYFLNFFFIKNYELVVIAAAVFISFSKLETKLATAEYLILHRYYELEINRYQCDIQQYGYFLALDSDLFFEYDDSSETLKNEFVKKTSKAQVMLELEILEHMHLFRTN